MCRPLGGNLGKWSVYMKSIVKSLPFRLLVGVVVGIALGLWAGGVSFGPQVMQVVLTIKELLGSIINFCVPLIIIGFIAPSITRLKQNASRMLLLALILALIMLSRHIRGLGRILRGEEERKFRGR